MVWSVDFLDAFLLQIFWFMFFWEKVVVLHGISCFFPRHFFFPLALRGICTSTPPASSSSVALREMPASPAASGLVGLFAASVAATWLTCWWLRHKGIKPFGFSAFEDLWSSDLGARSADSNEVVCWFFTWGEDLSWDCVEPWPATTSILKDVDGRRTNFDILRRIVVFFTWPIQIRDHASSWLYHFIWCCLTSANDVWDLSDTKLVASLILDIGIEIRWRLWNWSSDSALIHFFTQPFRFSCCSLEDHHWHLRWLGCPWWWCLQRQGPHQGAQRKVEIWWHGELIQNLKLPSLKLT